MKDSFVFLLMPLGAALLYSFGAVAVKRALANGATRWQIILWSNLAIALSYQPLLLMGARVGNRIPWSEAALCASCFFLGQMGTFLALHHGDVSVATPVLGTKVLFVTGWSAFLPGAGFKPAWAFGAVLSVLAIVIITGGGHGSRRGRLPAAFFSLGAAFSFGTADVMVQQWAPVFGLGLFLPMVFGGMGLMTLLAFPLLIKGSWIPAPKPGRRWLAVIALFFALQTMAMMAALGLFGHATAVNVIYNTRVIWSVLLAWFLAKSSFAHDATAQPGLMMRRLGGAVLLFAAVLVILAS